VATGAREKDYIRIVTHRVTGRPSALRETQGLSGLSAEVLEDTSPAESVFICFIETTS
jgi:hypothetical protein